MIPKLSIIIPTYKRYSELDDCLSSILVQEGSYELIIISDGFDKKTDNIITKIKHIYKNKSKNIIYLKQPCQGPAAARNNGLCKARGNIIVFLDDDCVVYENWIKNIIIAHKTYPKVLAIAGSIFPYDNHILSEFSQCLEGLVNIKDKTYFQSSLINNVSYKKQVFKNINFDAGFKHIAGEDVEFNYRLHIHEIRTLFIDNICVKHRYKNKLLPFLRQQFSFGFGRLNLMRITNDYPFNKSNKFFYVFKLFVTPLFDPWLRLAQAFRFRKKDKLMYLPIGYLQQIVYWSGFIWAFFKRLFNR